MASKENGCEPVAIMGEATAPLFLCVITTVIVFHLEQGQGITYNSESRKLRSQVKITQLDHTVWVHRGTQATTMFSTNRLPHFHSSALEILFAG